MLPGENGGLRNDSVRMRASMPILDAVRGVAALMVVGYHLITWQSKLPATDLAGRVLVSSLRPGWFGVDLFFILSGFLITNILLATRARRTYFRDFYIRRALRILPLYYLFLLASGLALSMLGTPPWAGVGIAAIFLANAASLFGVGLLGPIAVYWSLAVEEHFYLVWPFLVRWLSRGAMLALSVAIVACVPMFRGWAFQHAPGWNTYALTVFRIDALALGAIVGLLCFGDGLPVSKARRIAVAFLVAGGILGAGLIGTGNASRTTAAGTALQFTAVELVLAGLFLTALIRYRAQTQRVGALRAFAFFGDISYCLYLNHLLVALLVDAGYSAIAGPGAHDPTTLLATHLLRAVVIFALAVLVALCARRWIEIPVLGWKERLAPRS